jgi:hypothetical protein
LACPLAVWSAAYGAALGCGWECLFLAARIPSIEFVRVCKVRNVFFAHGERGFAEVRVVDCVDGVDSLAPVEAHEVFY